jgi:hypothetical protein
MERHCPISSSRARLHVLCSDIHRCDELWIVTATQNLSQNDMGVTGKHSRLVQRTIFPLNPPLDIHAVQDTQQGLLHGLEGLTLWC